MSNVGLIRLLRQALYLILDRHTTVKLPGDHETQRLPNTYYVNVYSQKESEVTKSVLMSTQQSEKNALKLFFYLYLQLRSLSSALYEFLSSTQCNTWRAFKVWRC